MRFASCLSNESIITLKEAMRNHPNFIVRVRAHAILLSNHRIRIQNIAKIYEVTRQTVSNWIEHWEDFDIVGLYDHPRSGCPPKLNFFEKKTVKALIEKTPNSPKVLLSKLFKTIGKSISRSTLRRIAKKIGFSWKTIRKSLLSKRDETKLQQAKKEIEELEKKRDEYAIYNFLDQSTAYQHQTVCHSRKEYAIDLDGDGINETHCNTQEEICSLVRPWIRGARGVNKRYLALYLAP